MDAPVAKLVPHTWRRPTGDVDDPWAWLRKRDDPDTIAYLEAENQYTASWAAEHGELISTLFEEIKSRVQETDLGVPVRHGGWYYVSRTEEGKSYPIHCRGTTAATADAQLLLDQNAEALGHDFFELHAFEPSPDHRLLAWSADVDGSERYVLRVRDLATGADLADTITDTAWAGVAWSAASDVVFYVRNDAQMRPYQVWRHRLGTAPSDDVLVFEDLDERYFVTVELTRSADWIIISSDSRTTSEARLVPADDPEAEPRLVRARSDEVEYRIDHWGDRWVILTNLDAEDFQVVTAPLDEPADWTPFIEHEPGRRITAIEPFADHLVVHEWRDAQQRLRSVFRDGTERVVDMGDDPHQIDLGFNGVWDTTTLRFVYQSLVAPLSVYDTDVVTGEHTLLKQTPTPNVDLGDYRSLRSWATAPDGTLVPVDIVHHRRVVADGTAPCVVYGYGSYEASSPPWFSVARLSLLDRGFVWALAHPRGGGELGRHWYLDGKLLNKRNTFTDTIAVTEHLIATKWADPERVAIRGGSAGGLLVGACITMRPDLYAAAVAEVPFVDVVTTMSDPTLPLTVTEWDEWGDPRVEPYASYMLGYSPYDNTVPADYPAIYVTAGLNDPRVSFHEPAKWVAKLRAIRTGDRPLLLKCEMGAGHGGPSGRYQAWRDEAQTLAFLIATVA
jgi:oligopeptidase B